MHNYLAISLTILAGISYGSTLARAPFQMDWETFKSQYGKEYHSIDDEGRARKIFERNSADVIAHNLQFQEGKVFYSKELNSFADMDPPVFNKGNEFRRANLSQISGMVPRPQKLQDTQIPREYDWRDWNCVSPVKDQGKCLGGDWTFSATGAMESQILIHRNRCKEKSVKNPILLSEQQLLDCCDSLSNETSLKKYGVEHLTMFPYYLKSGCDGGYFPLAWECVGRNSGIANASTYPYTSGQGGQCQYKPSMAAADIFGFLVPTPKGETDIKMELVGLGPLSIQIDGRNLRPYSSGIYSCNGSRAIDHGALLVGYGTDKKTGEDYWIAKNSWGVNWGEKGYFRLSRKADEDCGLTLLLALPILIPVYEDNLMDRSELLTLPQTTGPQQPSEGWNLSLDPAQIITLIISIGFLLVIIIALIVAYFLWRRALKSGYLHKNREITSSLLPKSESDTI